MTRWERARYFGNATKNLKQLQTKGKLSILCANMRFVINSTTHTKKKIGGRTVIGSFTPMVGRTLEVALGYFWLFGSTKKISIFVHARQRDSKKTHPLQNFFG